MNAAAERLAEASPPPEPAQPRVWLVLGDKRGDNAQVEVIAQALGWTCERRYVHMREPYVLGKPRVEPTLHHLDLARSDPLEPPWPDLIITIGRRPSMVALWVREQAGGRTKIVLVGKPSGRLEPYDLVIASAEAVLPRLPNVLPITLPLMRVDEGAIAEAAAAWRPRLAALPRPLIACLIGGATGTFVYDESVVDGLLAVATRVIADTGGTPYLVTSRRTPEPVARALAARLPPEARLFAWAPEAADNPYRALLGLADGFVVTGDSVSMMVEVARVGKPLAIFPVPLGRVGALDQLRRALVRRLFAPGPAAGGLRRRAGELAYRLGLVSQTRDFRAFHRLLIDRGLAVPLGHGFPPPTGAVPDDLTAVVARIEALAQAG